MAKETNLITRGEAAEIAGIAVGTFAGYVSRGQAPKPVRSYGRTNVWDEDEIREWVAHRPGQGTKSSDRALRRAAERQATTESSQD